MKQNTEEYMLHDSIYMKSKNTEKLTLVIEIRE